jgi:hypothetical protein
MLTLCIRYTLDATKLADFEAYGKSAAGPIERCGGKLVGYFAHTEMAHWAAQSGVLLVEERSFVQRIA